MYSWVLLAQWADVGVPTDCRFGNDNAKRLPPTGFRCSPTGWAPRSRPASSNTPTPSLSPVVSSPEPTSGWPSRSGFGAARAQGGGLIAGAKFCLHQQFLADDRCAGELRAVVHAVVFRERVEGRSGRACEHLEERAFGVVGRFETALGAQCQVVAFVDAHVFGVEGAHLFGAAAGRQVERLGGLDHFHRAVGLRSEILEVDLGERRGSARLGARYDYPLHFDREDLPSRGDARRAATVRFRDPRDRTPRPEPQRVARRAGPHAQRGYRVFVAVHQGYLPEIQLHPSVIGLGGGRLQRAAEV